MGLLITEMYNCFLGLVFIAAGTEFQLFLVPFHQWTLDIFLVNFFVFHSFIRAARVVELS